MELFIDADGCPVTGIAVKLARQYNCPCTLLCDTAHRMEYAGARTITVAKGADSVDFALVNLVKPGDLVVTQDYGLAAMCLSRRAIAIRANVTDEAKTAQIATFFIKSIFFIIYSSKIRI